MRSLLTALLFVALVVLGIGWLSCVGDKPETIIEFVPAAAPGCPRAPGRNPCAVTNCWKPDTRRFT